MKTAGQDNISVFLRVRPFSDKQTNTESILQKVDDKSIKVKNQESEHEFAFDTVFDQTTTQELVYEKVGKDVVQSAFEGFNGTIFAYGQTASGKTHTCIGPDCEDQTKKGILPRLIQHTFQKISQQPPFIQFRIKISMVEIYLQKIKDLFDVSKTDIKIRQNKSKGVYLQDITEQYVGSPLEALQVFKKGIANRTVGQTNMNDVSSRSHMAFLITLHQNNLKDASAKSGKIILVDLAGSQKVSKTQAQGKLLDQAKNINKSLSALGNVINSLTDIKISHIPYRDSKLTRLLQQSLGGNSKTRLIINISPSLYNFSESLSSLRFGFRAKQIKNKPRVNRQYTVSELLILLDKAQKKIEQLQAVIQEYSNSSSKKRNSSKVKAPTFAQNLLDSDNPILSGLSEAEQQNNECQKYTNHQSCIRQLRFDSQAQSDDDQQQDQHKHSSSSLKKRILLSSSSSQLTNKNYPQHQPQLQLQWQHQKAQMIETIKDLSFDRNQSYRQIQILEEKFEIAAKQARMLTSKFQSVGKENQKLLQKVIGYKMQCQSQQQTINILNQKVQSYEQSIKQMISENQIRQSKVSKVFGKSPEKKIDNQANTLIEKYQFFNIEKNAQEDTQDLMIQSKMKENQASLKSKIKELQGELALYEGLQATKQALINQKMSFVKQKQRVYKDLQNRIQKVIQLQEKLDQMKEKNKFLEDIVNSQQSEKGRKIINLQKHLDQTSENYYVLKGQQSSWLNNNKRHQKKMKLKDYRIEKLESQIIELRSEIQSLKMTPEQADKQIVDLDFSSFKENPFQKKQGKIVKVIKSKKKQ